MAIGTPTDAILTSVIGNRLDAVSREIGQTMLRTSRSPIFSEARDFVTAIFDRDLRLVAQTAYIPVLMGSTPYAMRAIAERFAGNVDEGDVFVLNDPYRGNNHPPDITVAQAGLLGGRDRVLVRGQGPSRRRRRRRRGGLQPGRALDLGGVHPDPAGQALRARASPTRRCGTRS